MVSYYTSVFCAAMVLTAVATGYARQGQNSRVGTSPAFKSFQFQYLAVYFFMMAGDWLQGPYVYALYSSYGFSQEDIAVLFVAGFGSSMFFGTFIGSLADRLGRKRFCLLYAALYVASCLTKHFNSYGVLMLGRLLGGVATSLLFSVFDAWMVFEHNKRGFDPEWMSGTFSAAAFGNSLVAIGAGMVAQAAADAVPLTAATAAASEGGGVLMYGGFCAPFDLAVVVLLGGAAFMHFTWPENYGGAAPTAAGADPEAPDQAESAADALLGKATSDAALSGKADGVASAGGSGAPPASSELSMANLMDVRGLQRGVELLRQDPAILACGLLQSLFEGSMYIFVFMWTPALTPGGGGGHGGSSSGEDSEPPPYGQMFATFMLMCMCGSSCYTILSKVYAAEDLLLRVYLVSAAALAVPVLLPGNASAAYMAFLLFELCVGVYFPSMGTMKSGVVPEESRAALYNLFRVPLNVIVLGVLLSDMASTVAFAWSASLLLAGAALQFYLASRLKAAKAAKDAAAKEPGNLDDLLSTDRD